MNKNTENFREKSHWITGEVQDIITDREGNVTVLPVDHNLVVNSCSNLIACLFKNSAVEGDTPISANNENFFTSAGIRYWAIGGIQGSNGSFTPDENTNPDQVKLTNEFYRAPILPENIVFVDNNGNEVAKGIITNRIKITVTIPYDEGNGTWYEFGLFGGNAASQTKDSGIMINRKVHDPISKTVNLQIQRTVIFTF